MFTGIDKADLRSEGIIGLARASRDFEPERSSVFRIFAIYKIKDAMREFVTTQSGNVRVPQYVRDALRLINNLKSILSKVYTIRYLAFTQIWELSEKLSDDDPIKEDVDNIRNSIINLANRSHTSISQLLERSEVIPLESDVELVSEDYKNMGGKSEEDSLIEMIHNVQIVENIKKILTEDEFNLLWDRFVNGKTVRELEGPLGITAESIVVRTNVIRDKLISHFKRMSTNEVNTFIEEDNSNYGC
jgi:RNA polymerase sigma factor (sigma-70 family)